MAKPEKPGFKSRENLKLFEMKKANLIFIAVTLSVFVLTGFGMKEPKEVKVGEQIWMSNNLNVDKLPDGTPIMHAKTIEEWNEAYENEVAAWCYYDNDPKNGEKYGKLYNLYAYMDIQLQLSDDWMIPNHKSWRQLVNDLGGIEGVFSSEKISGNDANDFTIFPAGMRNENGEFVKMGESIYWHHPYLIDPFPPYNKSEGALYFDFKNKNIDNKSPITKEGLYIRLVKNNE